MDNVNHRSYNAEMVTNEEFWVFGNLFSKIMKDETEMRRLSTL